MSKAARSSSDGVSGPSISGKSGTIRQPLTWQVSALPIELLPRKSDEGEWAVSNPVSLKLPSFKF
jgi:hypothetical protein